MGKDAATRDDGEFGGSTHGRQSGFPRKHSSLVVLPEGRRPAAFVRGSLYDLEALLWTTLRVLRRGTGLALRSLLLGGFSWGISASLLALATSLTQGSVGAVAFFFPAFAGLILFVSTVFLWGVVLAAHGAVAFGQAPRVYPVLKLAFLRLPLLCLTSFYSLILGFFFYSVAVMLKETRVDYLCWGIHVVLLVGGAAFLYARYVLLTQAVTVTAAPGEAWQRFNETPRLARGRIVLLGAIVALPVAIMATARTTPFVRGVIARALGAATAKSVEMIVAVLAFVVATPVESALIISALAVILATPVESWETTFRPAEPYDAD